MSIKVLHSAIDNEIYIFIATSTFAKSKQKSTLTRRIEPCLQCFRACARSISYLEIVAGARTAQESTAKQSKQRQGNSPNPPHPPPWQPFGWARRHPQTPTITEDLFPWQARLFIQALCILMRYARCNCLPSLTSTRPLFNPDSLLYTAFVASRLLRLVFPGCLVGLSLLSVGHVNDPCCLEISIYICIVSVCLCLFVGRCQCLSNCAPLAERLVCCRLASHSI